MTLGGLPYPDDPGQIPVDNGQTPPIRLGPGSSLPEPYSNPGGAGSLFGNGSGSKGGGGGGGGGRVGGGGKAVAGNGVPGGSGTSQGFTPGAGSPFGGLYESGNAFAQLVANNKAHRADTLSRLQFAKFMNRFAFRTSQAVGTTLLTPLLPQVDGPRQTLTYLILLGTVALADKQGAADFIGEVTPYLYQGIIFDPNDLPMYDDYYSGQ